MTQPDGFPQNVAPANAASLAIHARRLRRYLPAELMAALSEALTDPGRPSPRLDEASGHLATARYAITTYLPRLLLGQVLEAGLTSPWLRWIEGSLLFADLSGSTALAERLSALGREGTERVADFLNHIFATMIQVVQEYGGDLISFGGDALLIFFGDERHPRTAARAALALQQALHGHVQSVPGIGEFPIHLHVGVESGPIAFVSAGRPHALYYGVLGAVVNRVAIAEGLAGPGAVVAGPAAWATLADDATGDEVAPGYYQITRIRAPARPHAPLPAEPVRTTAPVEAIPHLLDDLDRISPYVPPALLARILAEPQQLQVEADLRPVTVLFAQVAGLELAERLPPDPAALVVQAYVERMQAAIEQFGGVVNKLDVADEGIKLVAIFGAPAAYEDHAERAARAALEMQHRLDDLNRQIASRVGIGNWSLEIESQQSLSSTLPSLRQRIGLNPGTVFAGNVGSALRKEYTVMGDAVNVAARVMARAAWGEVWVSEAAARAITMRLVCEPRGQMALKGKAAPLALFRLCGERDAPAALAPASGPLVGREPELAQLREHLHAALGGAGRAVRIVGEAGVGKTRLAAALAEEARGQGVRLIPATCFSYTATIPYAAWGEWLKSLCGIVAGDDDEVRRQKLSARLAELGPGMEEWLPLLGDLVRLDVPDNRLTRGLDPQMRQTRRFELLEQLLLRAADAGPVLVLFEDLHWSDPISLDLWYRVAQAVGDRPILLLGVHRPTPALSRAGTAEHLLELKELSGAESTALAVALAGEAALPEPLLRELVERAAGNPLFLAELLRAVLPKLKMVDGRSQPVQQEQAASYHLQSALHELPDSLNGLLLSRIDRLEESSRSVLRVASVIGQRIPFGVLQAIHNADQQVLLRQLARLSDEDLTLLERPAPPERVDAFRHALIQEVAYQSMLYARRRELHGRIGEYLEQRYGDDLDDYYGLLAHHYRLSDRRDKAIEYLLKAGHAAREVYANEEALQYYRWALEALAGDAADPRTWEARDALGEVYATIGRYDDALAQHRAILAAPGVSPDVACRAHRKLGSVLEKQGQYVQALEALDQAMAIARSGAPDVSPLAMPLISADIGLVRQRRGEYDLAIAACEEGLVALRDVARTRDAQMIEARLHSTLGAIFGMRGDYPRAQQHFEHSLQIREAVDDLPGVIISHNNLGYLWQLQSEYERALDHYRLAEELARKINLRYMLVFATLNSASALISLGAYEEARARCGEALALSRELNDRRNIAQIHDTLGVIAYHQGAYDQALAAYAEELRVHRELGSAYHEANTLMNMALALNAQGRIEEATAAAGQALARAEALQSQRLKAEALNALAEAALLRGDAAAATQYAGEAAALSREIGSKHDHGVACRLLGQAAAAQGQPFAPMFEESITLFEAIKDRFELGRTYAAYGAALTAHGDKSAARAYLKQAQDAFVAIGASGELRRLAPVGERSV
jgi:class 3 adenylate cyclase/tetratricopeptide (TPR) repeat protein